MSRVLFSTTRVCQGAGDRLASLMLVEGRVAALDGCLAVPADIKIDAGGLTAAPGLVDVQINGGHGIDLTNDPAALWALGEILPRYGVTAFLPTLITAPLDVTAEAMGALRQRPLDYRGAEPLGLHLEGPVLSAQYRGAHPKQHLLSPSEAPLRRWTHGAGVVMVTLAPELPGAIEVVKALVRQGVVVAAGHSGATAEESLAAVDAGVTAVTHIFNAMAPLHHRDPNLVSVALTNPTLTVGLIADGIHVDPLVVDLVWNAKGAARLALVSDAVAAMGAGGGSFTLGDAPITSDESGVRRLDGSLAGSGLTLIEGVRNLVSFTSASRLEALRCASSTPAELVGATGRGSLDVGDVADVVLLDDRLEVALTVCRGDVSYVAPAHSWRITRESDRAGVQWT